MGDTTETVCYYWLYQAASVPNQLGHASLINLRTAPSHRRHHPLKLLTPLPAAERGTCSPLAQSWWLAQQIYRLSPAGIEGGAEQCNNLGWVHPPNGSQHF
jgi:hypothetical protein